VIVAEATTCRRHIEANHKVKYLSWAAMNGFMSMLPGDMKCRNAEAKAGAEAQLTLDSYLQQQPIKECIVPYTDPVFCKAMIEWLVSTDQPIQALEHPAFQNMMNISAHAKDGVKIPNRKQTQQEIVNMFKAQLSKLHNHLNVCILYMEFTDFI
ncbi:hypothetical protein BU17DRAFT_40587, partial [Hysterangium stoloniferum]